MTDDREFDRILEEELSDLPLPEGEAEEITPWKRAMGRITWGIGLTTITLNFWYLNYLLPAIGIVLLWLGFRTLRRENKWFTAGWLISVYQAAAKFTGLVANATLWRPLEGIPWWMWLTLAIPFVQLICLWQGIRAVRRKAGQPDEARAAGALVVWYGVLCVLAIIGVEGWLLILPILIAYICILKNLSRMSALLDGAGYEVKAAPVRVSDRTVWLIWTAALAACIPLAGLLFSRYPMEWTPRDQEEQVGLEELRANLLELGMQENVLDDLAPDDLRLLEGALSVTTQIYETSFNEGREATTAINTVYDVKELRLSDIAVELPGGHWRIIHHFLWQTDPGIRTTECIKLWPTSDSVRLKGWRQEGAFTGRLLYDWKGTTYTGDYYRIATEDYVANSIFFGESQNSATFAVFSLPRRGEDCRGYLTYGVEMVEKGWIIDSWNNYTHQISWFNYPLITAQEHDRKGYWNGARGFSQSQTAIQFYPWDEEEKGACTVVTDK